MWSSQPGFSGACLVSHETPEVTSVAHAPTGSFHPFPSPLQHDILIPMCSRGVSRWEGEEKREEASTWALFPGNARTVRQSTPGATNRLLFDIRTPSSTVSKKVGASNVASFRGMIGRGCKFPLAEDESVLLDICIHRDNQAVVVFCALESSSRSIAQQGRHLVGVAR